MVWFPPTSPGSPRPRSSPACSRAGEAKASIDNLLSLYRDSTVGSTPRVCYCAPLHRKVGPGTKSKHEDEISAWINKTTKKLSKPKCDPPNSHKPQRGTKPKKKRGMHLYSIPHLIKQLKRVYSKIECNTQKQFMWADKRQTNAQADFAINN